MTRATTDKVVILAGGLGSRMRKQDEASHLSAEQAAVAETGVKAMIPIERPFLDYVLTALADAGFRQVCLVTGPDHHELRRYYGATLGATRFEVSFAIQPEPLGTANALIPAEEFTGDDDFLMINSDNFYPVSSLKALRELGQCGLAAFDLEAMIAGSNIPRERLVKFAVVLNDGDGFMKRIIEKPDEATLASLTPPIGVSMNCWRFDRRIYDACRRVPRSTRGEYELPDAVQLLIDEGKARFRSLTVEAPVLDLTSRADVGPVAERLEGYEIRV